MASRTVLITGCSTGIGRATAARLATSGWTVYASARRPETLVDLEARGCRVLALDVTSEDSMQAAVETTGPVGVLINNAGYSQSGALETLPMDAVRRQFETNVFGLLRLTQLVLPAMRAAGEGKIVNVSSMGGRLTFPGGGAYHATKYAVEALSDALRMEVGRFGIDVICIEPGLIRTEFGATAAAGVTSSGSPPAAGSAAPAAGGVAPAAGSGSPAAGEASDGGEPYAAFNAAVAKSTRAVYEGPLSRLGGDADAVARAIERALEKPRAPTRVPVTASARLLMVLRRVLPDRAWDRVVGAGFRG